MPLPPLLRAPPRVAPVPADRWTLTGSVSVPPELHAQPAETSPDTRESDESGRDFSIVGPLEQNSNRNAGLGIRAARLARWLALVMHQAALRQHLDLDVAEVDLGELGLQRDRALVERGKGASAGVVLHVGEAD